MAKPKTAAKHAMARKDYGAPIEGFLAKQPPNLRKILVELRTLILAAAPDADGSLKWGMPHYTLNGAMFAATGAHKAHVNLIMVGPPASFVDPEGRLEGEGKGGRHLKLRSTDEIPRASVKKWLAAAAKYARSK
ncbi:MAG TPA: DUF1801 domain-containing protein [Kofleriaceae bacterium]|nr:DUF1801 domain-containing protein [Kofleriaceae bacterium]